MKTYLPSMVQAITVLTVLKMMTKAQTSCGGGMGRVMYERLPNHQLQGFDDDVVRDTAPPFMVLEKCQDLCIRDRTASNNIVRTCTSFDFQPGSRIASYSGSPEYEESTCYLTREQAVPEGIGNLMLVPNSVHFTEVCITSNRPERECPNRRYVFERHPRKKLTLDAADLKEMTAANRTECEDRCLNEFSFVCRSASYDSAMRMCYLSRFTRRTHPELLKDDANSDYLENTCLNSERRCDGLAVFIKEENKRLGGPFEVDSYMNLTLEECQSMCLRAEKYFCRSLEFDEMTKQCTLSEEDSVSQKDDLGISSSPTHHFYDLVCLDNLQENSLMLMTLLLPARGSEYPDNSVTSHLFSNGRRPDTAFQRYRNSRLGGEFHSEITGRTLSECLDECLRQTSFQCMSAVYSDRFHTCRLSRYNQRNGMRIIYDADYDYYENLMLGDGEGTPGTRPDPMGQDSNWGQGRPTYYPPSSGGHTDRYPIGGPGTRYPPVGGGRYPPVGGDRYPPPGGDRYPPPGGDRYPSTDRYPSRYPYDRNPTDRYPPGGTDRYPPGDRYPYDRYPATGGRYPTDRVPLDRYPPPTDRYPYDRYPAGGDRYPAGGGRYPPERYPPSSSSGRYPPSSSGGTGRYPPSSSGGTGRYPPSSSGGYPTGYPSTGGRYPPPPVDRYPPSSSGGNRYPVGPGPGRYPPVDDRYPAKGDRYPPGDRYGGTDNRFNAIDYYGGDRDRYSGGGGAAGGDRWYYTGRRPGYDPYRPGPGGPTAPVGSPGPAYDPYRPSPGLPGYDTYRPGVVTPPIAIGGPGLDPYRPGPGRPDIYRPGPGGPGGHYDSIRPGYDGYRGGRPGFPGPDGGYPADPGYSSFGGVGPGRPYSTRCDEGENFKQVGVRQRVRRQFVRRFTTATSLAQCQRECVEARDFICRSFNYKESASGSGPGPASYDTAGSERDNCELSDRDSRDLDINNPTFFDTTGNFDYYERSAGRDGVDGECLDVSQVCNEDGMEFTLRTPEGFVGRIYTYGFYDRCFFRGNGGTVNVLRISGPQGYPECGTQRYGDTMTNIVVVQFSDYVQTGKDKRFNLTCLFRGPGEAVVTSGYIGAGSGSPIPIEYLPAENSLSSKVRLMILYQGRPTTTIAVGDPLTFRLEAQDGYNYMTDIFATNVIARDPYSGRSVQLIDRFGCPVDSYVFPELDKSREGDILEARFNAFKIPESNFLVFEATVRTCRDGCQPAYCTSGTGRSEPSFGRKRRDINGTLAVLEGNNITMIDGSNDTSSLMGNETVVYEEVKLQEDQQQPRESPEYPEYVREMIEVFESREELQQEARKAVPLLETVCLTTSEYHGLISAVLILIILLVAVAIATGLAYRRYYTVMNKNLLADRNSIHSTSYPPTRSSGISLFAHGLQNPFASTFGRAREYPPVVSSPHHHHHHHHELPDTSGMFEDPSEPIYTDPSLFERSRSLRSISVSQKRRHSHEGNI